VLDVLDLDAVRSPHKDGIRVRSVDDVCDLDPAPLCFLDVLVGRLHLQSKVIEERAFGVLGLPLLELDERAADDEPAVIPLEAKGLEPGRRLLRIRDREGDVIEVVGGSLRHLDEADRQAGGRDEGRPPRPRALDCNVGRKLGERLVEIEDPYADPGEGAGTPVSLGGKERHLAETRVGSDKRELVRPLDDVHPESVDEEVGQRVAVAHPEGYVIQRLRSHTPESTHNRTPKRACAGKHSFVSRNGRKQILLLAARQSALEALLEDAGFDVDSRPRLPDDDLPDAQVAVVFRGRLIGRNQAARLQGEGRRVIEVFTSEPTTPSTRDWLRLSNRISKADLVQIVRSVADDDAQ
jgi:hypothetical protein